MGTTQRVFESAISATLEFPTRGSKYQLTQHIPENRKGNNANSRTIAMQQPRNYPKVLNPYFNPHEARPDKDLHKPSVGSIRMCMYVCMYVCKHACICICIYVYVYVDVDVDVDVDVYVCMYIYIYTYIYIYMYTYI